MPRTSEQPVKTISLPVLALLLVTKLGLHAIALTRYGFHRDELLYLAQGQHPGWGHYSTPPFTGWVSWLVQHTLGDSLWATRLPVVLVSCATVYLIVKSAAVLGGGRFAQLLAGLCFVLAPAGLRSGMLFQPVAFDIFFWTLLCYLVLRYVHRADDRWLYAFGVVLGLSLLNKYMTGLLLLVLLPVLALSGQQRLFRRRAFWWAAGIALLLILPNLLWQWRMNWPVIGHLSTLSSSQLVNVRIGDFLLDQVLMYGAGCWVWLPAVYFLLRYQGGRYRVLTWTYLGVVLILLILRGKSYYTLGMYPVLLAAGGVAWATWAQRIWQRVLVGAMMVTLNLGLLPISLPILSLPGALQYNATLVENGIDGPVRWEDGEIHPLPQDYADMLGWEELGALVDQALRQIPDTTPLMLFGGNYGHAGATSRFSQEVANRNIPVISFSDTYRYWVPARTDARAVVYIDDETSGDLDSLFGQRQLIGRVENELAREYGTLVYLYTLPRHSFGEFWAERIAALGR